MPSNWGWNICTILWLRAWHWGCWQLGVKTIHFMSSQAKSRSMLYPNLFIAHIALRLEIWKHSGNRGCAPAWSFFRFAVQGGHGRVVIRSPIRLCPTGHPHDWRHWQHIFRYLTEGDQPCLSCFIEQSLAMDDVGWWSLWVKVKDPQHPKHPNNWMDEHSNPVCYTRLLTLQLHKWNQKTYVLMVPCGWLRQIASMGPWDHLPGLHGCRGSSWNPRPDHCTDRRGPEVGHHEPWRLELVLLHAAACCCMIGTKCKFWSTWWRGKGAWSLLQ